MQLKQIVSLRLGIALVVVLITALGSANTLAKPGARGNNQLTLIMMGDLHGTLVPHAAVLKNPDGSEYSAYQAGGLAKLKTVVDGIRRNNPKSLLLSCGDLTHGSAETLFTVGDAMIRPMNAFGIDVFTPGNWDFGYGPAVFRNRFTSFGPKPALPANIQVMAGYIDCGGLSGCQESPAAAPGVIRANFPSVAVNVYNNTVGLPLPDALHNKRVLEPYKILEVNGVKVAVIGITAAIVPQQPDVFNIGLTFTQGVEELPGIIEQVKTEGASVIVVQSELGLSQNIEIARRFKDIDVMYSAHTHEVTMGALLADADAVTATTPGSPRTGEEVSRLARGATIVVETNRDMYVGRLDIQVAGGKLVGFDWEAIPVDDSVDSDPIMAALVAEIEEDFVAGTDGQVQRHSFLPGGYCPAGDCGDTSKRGLQLVDDLDTPVGNAGDVLLLRHQVLEDELNNFIADALLEVTDAVVEAEKPNDWEGVDVTMTNGFRFGNAVLPRHEITLRDLYTWFPISPAVAVSDFPGQVIQNSLDGVLSAVFNRNPFLQRGGWYLGLGNMEQLIDLDNRPFSSSGGRVVETLVGGEPLDTSKRYVFASCYPHGDSVDRICRTNGGSNKLFFELADPDNYNSPLSLVAPLNDEKIVQGAAVKQVAPDAFLHPVHVLRRYLDLIGGEVSGTEHGLGRIATVDSTDPAYPAVPPPVAEPDPSLVQPPQGAGPLFFSGRIGN